MQLRKTSENINRTYNPKGEAAERVDSIQYDIVDAGGAAIGSAQAGHGWANASVSLGGLSSIEEAEAKLAAIFGIEETAPND